MSRYLVRPREDGKGPYVWRHVVKSHSSLRQGDIYTQLGDDLNINDVSRLISMCDKAGFEMCRDA